MSEENKRNTIQLFGRNRQAVAEEIEEPEEFEDSSKVEDEVTEETVVPRPIIPETKIDESILSDGIRNFGRIVVPVSISNEQINKTIDRMIKNFNDNYQFIKAGTKQKLEHSSNVVINFVFADTTGNSKYGTIEFVLDRKPIIYVDDFVIDGGSELEKINWQKNVKAFDKQDGDISKLVRWDYQAVNVTKDGIYPVTYSVVNSKGETTKVTVLTRVKILAPVLDADDITMTATISPNKRLLMAQVTARDVLDGTLLNQVIVDDSQVNYEIVGNYPIIYRVKNSFGLETIVEKSITVEAQEPELVVSALKIKATSDTNEVDWLAHARAVDPIDGDISHQISVDNHEVDLQRGGTYSISYQVTNNNGKTMMATSSVIVSVPQPQITATTFEIERGSDLSQFNWLGHVSATDEDGTDLTQYITTFYEEINPNETGEYNLYYMVRNRYQQQTTKRVTVSVK